MTTTLLNCEVLLSKDISDYFVGTTTSATAGGTITDTSLGDYTSDDWISSDQHPMTAMLTSGSYTEQERTIASFDEANTKLVMARDFGGSVASGVTYRVHRVFTAEKKREALLAAKDNVFGNCYDLVWDESLVSGNWLKDGSFEDWTNGTALANWTASVVVPTQCSTSGLFKHGSYSALLAGTIGTVSQSISNFDDLKYLAGKTVTFTMQGHCNTASCLRLAIYDGTTTTYSSHHDGGTAWTQNNPRNDSFYVQATVSDNPNDIGFKICHDIAGGTSYIDDARVVGPYRSRLFIGSLAMAQNHPNEVYIEPTYYSQEEPWLEIKDWEVDEGGYLHLPTSVLSDRRLRIIGKQYLDFKSSGTSSTSWSATINLNEPHTRILSAQAALCLYTWMSMPNYETGTREDYQGMIGFWEREVSKRKAKFGMPPLNVTTSWGFE